MKLNKKLLLTVIPVLLLVCLVAVASKVVSTNSALNTEAELKLTIQAQNAAAETEAYMQKYTQYLEGVAEDASVRDAFADPSGYSTYLADRLTKQTDILAVYMSNNENVWIDSTLWVPDGDFVPSQRPWYQAALSSDQTVVLQPYLDADTGKMIVSIAKQITKDGQAVGVVSLDLALDGVVDFISATVGKDGSYSFLVDSSGSILAHPMSELQPADGKVVNMSDVSNGVYDKLVPSLKSGIAYGTKIDDYDGEKRALFSCQVNNTDWTIISAYSMDAFQKELVSGILIGFVIFAFAVVIIILMLVSFGKQYFTPILQVSEVLRVVADGSLNVDTCHIKKNSYEINQLVTSLNATTSLLSNYISDIDRISSEMSNGNFDVSVSQHFIGDYVSIERALTNLSDKMSLTLSQITSAASHVTNVSDQVSGGALALAQGATEQASSVEQLSASVTELSSQVKTNAEKSGKAQEMANQAKVSINNGNEQMQALMNAMNDIHRKSSEINKIIKTIEDIAFQTNILALNAAVEAARAGSAGKGFAVVADEVRNLAGKSAEAAKNTTALIESSVASINEGVSLTDITAQGLMDVVQNVSATTELIVDISDASKTQSDAISEVTSELNQISQVVQSNSATSQESSAISHELSSQAGLLKTLVSRFVLKNGSTDAKPESAAKHENKPVTASRQVPSSGHISSSKRESRTASRIDQNNDKY